LMEWDSETASNLVTQPRTWNTLKMLRSAHSNLSSIAVALAGESSIPISEDIKYVHKFLNISMVCIF